MPRRRVTSAKIRRLSGKRIAGKSAFAIEIKNDLDAAVKATIKVYTNKAKPIMRAAFEQILLNMENRYWSVFKGTGSRRGINIPASVRSASKITFNPDGIVIQIADEEKLDKLTQLPPTVSEGKVYSLFSLLREGWGKRGGKRQDNYVLYMLTSTLDFNRPHNRGGRVAPYPDLVRKVRAGRPVAGTREGYILPLIGRMYVFVKHPGFVGYDWIQKAANENFGEDRKVFNDALKEISKMASKEFNKKRSKFMTITRK
jgi:hypothetical protein